MKVLIVCYHDPYDGGDVVWNALRVAAFQQDMGDEVSFFLLSDAVTLVHEETPPPADTRYDVRAELEAALKAGVAFEVCGTCLKNRALAADKVRGDVPVATLKDLSDWLHAAERVLSF